MTERLQSQVVELKWVELTECENVLTMIIALAWRIGHNDFSTTVRGVICPLSFFAVIVTDIISITLFKLRKKKKGFDLTKTFS